MAEGPAPQTFFILSMGHRIQFLDYDAVTDQVNVTQYRSKRGQNNEDESNAYTYHYELWVPPQWGRVWSRSEVDICE